MSLLIDFDKSVNSAANSGLPIDLSLVVIKTFVFLTGTESIPIWKC